MAQGYCFQIEGHVNVPNQPPISESSNSFKLSQDRANRIYRFLLEHGIPEDRISWKGYGNWRMLYPKAIFENEQRLNRRVEVFVVPCAN